MASKMASVFETVRKVYTVARYAVAGKVIFFLGSVLSPGLGIYGLYKWRRWSIVASIDASLRRGIRPSQLTSVAAVDRSELEEDIRRKFIDVGKDTARFGVILGPSGTGKTTITRKVCCKEPTSGVLYFEVREPLFLATNLADAVGLQWKPGFWDAVFENFLPSKYLTYYKMPEGPDSLSTGISFVLDVLAERAASFNMKKKHPLFFCRKNLSDHSPVLFLDGVDLLARDHPRAFIKLVDCCKVLSNNQKLRIVLVSSEGNIMPLINATSAKLRAFENVMEILGIDDEMASEYLIKHGMQKSLSKRVAKFIGGIFVHLYGATVFMKEAKKANPKISEDELYNVIKDNMVNDMMTNLGRARAAGEKKQVLLKHLAVHGPFNVNELMTADDEWNEQIFEAVNTLVKYNLLRYDRYGKLTWHSRLAEKAVIEALFKNNTNTN